MSRWIFLKFQIVVMKMWIGPCCLLWTMAQFSQEEKGIFVIKKQRKLFNHNLWYSSTLEWSYQNVLWKSYHDEKIMNMKHIHIYIYIESKKI